jgi:hypothetical protein
MSVGQGVRDDYMRAARLVSNLEIDVLLEPGFGIFGGFDREYVPAFARSLAHRGGGVAEMRAHTSSPVAARQLASGLSNDAEGSAP